MADEEKRTDDGAEVENRWSCPRGLAGRGRLRQSLMERPCSPACGPRSAHGSADRVGGGHGGWADPCGSRERLSCAEGARRGWWCGVHMGGTDEWSVAPHVRVDRTRPAIAGPVGRVLGAAGAGPGRVGENGVQALAVATEKGAAPAGWTRGARLSGRAAGDQGRGHQWESARRWQQRLFCITVWTG